MAIECKVPGLIGGICRGKPDGCVLDGQVDTALGINPMAAVVEFESDTYQECPNREEILKKIRAELKRRGLGDYR